MTKTKFEDWCLIDYKQAWDKQQEIFNIVVKNKDNTQNLNEQRIIFCEHPNVYTLGKNGNQNNLLINDDFLKKINATYYHIDRGGDITYHGPGQIVGYPIIDLEYCKLSLKDYVFQLEQSIIDTLFEYDIIATRLHGASGVWLGTDMLGKTRKICAIGVKASKFVTMHGFAFNINTDLKYFNFINPCGFVDKGVTSLNIELKKNIDIEEVKNKLKIHLFKNLNLQEV